MVTFLVKLAWATVDSGGTVLERLTRLETLLLNHLQWHASVEKYLLYPILVGVVIILFKDLVVLSVKYKNNKKKKG